MSQGPAVSSPPVQKCCAEMMSVSVAGIQKNRCRTTVAERMGETRAELPFIGDQVVCLSHDQAARSGSATEVVKRGSHASSTGLTAFGGPRMVDRTLFPHA